MKFKILSLLILFSIHLYAKKAPKWKDGNFKTSSIGLHYKIIKQGENIPLRKNDIVEADIYTYKRSGQSLKYLRDSIYSDFGNFSIGDEKIPGGIIQAIYILKNGGKGYFIIPPYLSPSADTFFCFIHVKNIIHMRLDALGKDSIVKPNDSINFVVTDSNKKYFGDTLFSLMKLVEQPQLTSCGGAKILIAFKFEMTYYDNGVVHKNILIFIECPDFYGKDYFVVGTNYMVTCVPLLDDLKNGSRTMNSYSLEKLDKYYCLRIRKM